jgi:hypothetical protein
MSPFRCHILILRVMIASSFFSSATARNQMLPRTEEHRRNLGMITYNAEKEQDDAPES